MTAPIRYRGQPVSEGVGAGEIYLGDAPAGADPNPGEDDVRAAFAAVARERAALAARLREHGQDLQAGIVDIGALIAADPALIGPVINAIRAGADGVAAVSAAAEAQAAVLAALPDPDLAQRAGDVRQVAAAVLDHLRGTSPPTPPAGKFILVRREVDPADLIQLADSGRADSELVGAVSVAGGASSHAAIVARGLGLPMLAGADPAVLAAAAGHHAILDTAAGELIVDPPELDLAAASLQGRTAPDRRAPQQVRTADGEPVTLLCNVASAAETRLGLSGGAAGVGLLRTEIAFTGASSWPSQAGHLAQLTPVLGLLAGRPAVVRLLDFSGDKVPPFLGHGQEQGLAALLHAPAALEDQLRAILRAGAGTRLAVLVPMEKKSTAGANSAAAAAVEATSTMMPSSGGPTPASAAALASAARTRATSSSDVTIGTRTASRVPAPARRIALS